MNVFAGFWVDGAVRKPEARHTNALNHVVYQIKGRGADSVAFFTANYKSIDSDCIWLDTTPRESMTPEELLSVLKTVWIGCGRLCKNGDASWFVDEITDGVKVDWGSLTQYPPPIEPQWVRVTRENVGQYLFRECRFRDSDSQEWRNGKVAGWCETDDNCLVNSDFHDDLFVMQFNFVEVQNAPTP